MILGVFLYEALRGIFVCGLKEDMNQQKLLSEKDSDFKGACEMAFGMEMAMGNLQEVSNSHVLEVASSSIVTLIDTNSNEIYNK